MNLKTYKITDLKCHPKNYNTHPETQILELSNSLDLFDQVKNIVVWQGKVIAGNGLYLAAKKKKLKTIEVQDVSDWPEEKAIKFMVADNRLSELGIIDTDVLSGLLAEMDDPFDIPGIDEDFLNDLDAGKKENAGKGNDAQTLEPDAIVKEQIESADKIIYQFSGGRDSTLAILKTLELVRGKEPIACYVDTGTEFPDLLYFVYNFCKEHNLPLEILKPKHNFFEYYGEKKCFPDPVYRDCIGRLINTPVDDMFFSYNNALMIRGGRKKQKTSRSKSNVYQEIIKSKNKVIKLLNPLFLLSNDEYDEDIKSINIWPGYDNGFIRTACWCCPFQRKPQWEALKVNYFLLWESMKELSKTWEFKKIKGDGCIKQFKSYWDAQ